MEKLEIGPERKTDYSESKLFYRRKEHRVDRIIISDHHVGRKISNDERLPINLRRNVG